MRWNRIAKNLEMLTYNVSCKPSLVRFERLNQITAQFGFTGMAMGADGVVVACLDKQLKTFSLQGKLVKQIKIATSRDGQLTKVIVGLFPMISFQIYI